MTEPGDDTPRHPPVDAPGPGPDPADSARSAGSGGSSGSGGSGASTERPSTSEPPSTSGDGWRPTPLWYMAEIIVVVVGVIIALAADAWWGSRQEAALEDEVLRVVRLELETNRTALTDVLAGTDDCLDRTDRFLRRTPASLRSIPDDSTAYWVQGLSCRRTFDAAVGSAAALSGAPGLDSVDDLVIRSAVAAWITAVDDAEEERADLSAAGAAVYEIMTGYAVDRTGDGLAAFPTIPRLVARGGPPVVAALRADTALIEQVVMRSHFQQAYRQELSEALGALDYVLEVLPAGGD